MKMCGATGILIPVPRGVVERGPFGFAPARRLVRYTKEEKIRLRGNAKDNYLPLAKPLRYVQNFNNF